MTTNLTLITSIVITAAISTLGTYYVTTRVDPVNNTTESVATQQPVPVAATTQQPNSKPINVAENQRSNKPLEIVVRTEVTHKEKPHRRTNYIAEGIAARSSPQPHYGVLPSH